MCIKEYQIELFSKNETILKTTTANGFLLTNLKAGQQYFINVNAVYNDGQKSSNASKEFTTAENCKYKLQKLKLKIPIFDL